MNHLEIKNYIHSQAWAIMPSKLEALTRQADNPQLGARYSGFDSTHRPSRSDSGAVAVIQIHGTITQRPTIFGQFFGDSSTQGLAKEIRAAADDPNVKSIILDVDSPGGSVYGVMELSRVIFEARQKKHIVAVANSLMASAAYWIGTAAGEVVVTPGGEVGGIGVFTVHADFSQASENEGVKTTIISAGKYKVEGNRFEPLKEEARDAIQSDVNEFYSMFVADVARNRGISTSTVRNGYGQGRVLNARAALKEGVVDKIATLDETLTRLSGRGSRFGAVATNAGCFDIAIERMRLDLLEVV